MKNFNTLEEFINNYSNCTFGLNIITKTTPSFQHVTNSFNGHNVVKITLYKNAMCGCSYQKAIESAVKNDFPDLQGKMKECVINAVNTEFNDKLPWGKWLNYPFIIENTNKKTHEYNKFLRVYNNFKRTKIYTYYLVDGKILDENEDMYKTLMNEIKEHKMSTKQADFGLKQAVIPCAYNINNIIFAEQGEKKYINESQISRELWKFFITLIS